MEVLLKNGQSGSKAVHIKNAEIQEVITPHLILHLCACIMMHKNYKKEVLKKQIKTKNTVTTVFFICKKKNTISL